MALDSKLIRAIRNDRYDAWSKADSDTNLEPFVDDQNLRSVRVDPWEQVIAWRFKRLGEPNVFVRFQCRRIRTAWGFGRGVYPYQLPQEEYLTPVYVVSDVRESDEDFLSELDNFQRRAFLGKYESTTLIYDATTSGTGVENQIWNLRGFRRIVPLRIIGNDGLKPDGYLSVVGLSSVLAELEHVFDQQRIRIPDDRRLDRMSRDLASMRVEQTPQGYYRPTGKTEQSMIQVWTLAMGLSLVESESSHYGDFKWYA
jgi:hypothetical protein